jgi:hypothetical protein
MSELSIETEIIEQNSTLNINATLLAYQLIIITAILFVELTEMEEVAKVIVIPGLITSIAASIYSLYRMFR